MKAFLVTIWNLKIITATLTAGKARYANYKGARDAGYRVKLTQFRVQRAPEFDALAATVKPGTVLGSVDADGVRWGCLVQSS